MPNRRTATFRLPPEELSWIAEESQRLGLSKTDLLLSTLRLYRAAADLHEQRVNTRHFIGCDKKNPCDTPAIQSNGEPSARKEGEKNE